MGGFIKFDPSGLSRDDLIWIIKRMTLRNGDYELMLAVRDLHQKKEQARFAKAEQYSKVADQKRREYIEILAPYDGKPLLDIPLDVLERADKALKEARDADAKWCKLMGL